MLFQTERLQVRKLSLDDLQAFHLMQSNLDVMRYVGGKAFTWEENRSDLVQLINRYNDATNSFGIWAVVDKVSAAFLGTCALVLYEEETTSEIGYRFLQKYWGNGYGSEITNGLIKYAFTIMKVERLVAFVDVKNKPSINILEHSSLLFQKEFYNKKEGCYDRFYSLEKSRYSF